ncbi:DUF6412 domain-containing protein [Thermoactinospora rubra]|uniref:DUF6412 domain-containing protein n=1 Tax=Thermoactinospora rubra TaxID=1088767 RepID=UPI000A0FA86D|nr:DUF6412 domain-containing protein [Thermoactinospora rubra]
MTFLFALALLHDPAGLIVVASLLLAFWASGRLPTVREPGVPAFVRMYGRRTAFLRQRDPDAAGRPRPRAPSLRPVFT